MTHAAASTDMSQDDVVALSPERTAELITALNEAAIDGHELLTPGPDDDVEDHDTGWLNAGPALNALALVVGYDAELDEVAQALATLFPGEDERHALVAELMSIAGWMMTSGRTLGSFEEWLQTEEGDGVLDAAEVARYTGLCAALGWALLAGGEPGHLYYPDATPAGVHYALKFTLTVMRCSDGVRQHLLACAHERLAHR